MKLSVRQRERRGFALLGIPLVVVVILVALAISSSFSVMSTRRSFEFIRARQLGEQAVGSAFEEAAERVSVKMGMVPLARPGDPALPDRVHLEWPTTIDPELVRADLAADGVELSPVSLNARSARWEILQDGDLVVSVMQDWGFTLDRHDHLIQEAGIVDLGVHVRVTVGPVTISRQVDVRRYVTVQPLEASGGGLPTQGRVLIMSKDLTHKLVDQ